MSIPRFHAPGARPPGRAALPEDAAHHAAHVLRLRSGDQVRVFDGDGHEFEARIQSLSGSRMVVDIGEAVDPRPESSLRLILALSPLKGDLMDLVIQKTTELGVSEIRPVLTERTDVEARPSAGGARDQRWRRIAATAAAQCGRAVVPPIHPALPLSGFVTLPLPERRVVLVESGPHPALKALEPADAVVAFVGPAGGLAPADIETLRRAGFISCSLGPRVLRSETAAIVAVSMLQAFLGDLG